MFCFSVQAKCKWNRLFIFFTKLVCKFHIMSLLKLLVDSSEAVNEAKNLVRNGMPRDSCVRLYNSYTGLLQFAIHWYEHVISTDVVARIGPSWPMLVHVMLTKRLLDIEHAMVAVSNYRDNTGLGVDFVQDMLRRNTRVDVDSLLEHVKEIAGDVRQPSVIALPATPRSAVDNGTLPDGLIVMETGFGGYDTIIGQAEAVQTVRSTTENTLNTGIASSVVLYGPPGTGKTSLALATAVEFNIDIYAVLASSLGGHFVGEREANIVRVFDFLLALQRPYILLIDEADSFLRRSTAEDRPDVLLTRSVTMTSVRRLLDKRNETAPCVLMMSTNFLEFLMEEVLDRSITVLVTRPRTVVEMYNVLEYYRNARMLNFSKSDLDGLAKEFVEREFSPSHVAVFMTRVYVELLLSILAGDYEIRPMERANWKPLQRPVYLVNREQIDIFPDSIQMVVLREEDSRGRVGEGARGDAAVTVVNVLDAARAGRNRETNEVNALHTSPPGNAVFPLFNKVTGQLLDTDKTKPIC